MTAAQIRAAEQRGIAHVWDFARACARTGFPFCLGLAILEKESRGRNVYGHDVGGAMYVPRPKNLEVTAENYREFCQLVAAGHRPNGVGPMQITYAPYHLKQAPEAGLRLWVPYENMTFGCRILARGLVLQLAKDKPTVDAYWEVARAWNGGTDPDRGREYADDAVRKARGWFDLVGNDDAPNFTL